jgi:phytoene synthase
MAELDADRALALTYVSTRKRPALTALWQLDAALGAVLAGGREPLISQIKLAWWREALEKLDNAKAPSEPVLEALSAHALPAGVSGGALSRLEEGWTVLLSQEPLGDTELSTYSAARGALLFRLSGLALGEQLTPAMERAGEVWALADLARHSNPIDAEAAIGRAKALLPETGGLRWPSPLRPLGMLAALAQRDLERGLGAPEPHGSPGRMLRMLRLRITGR